MQIRGPEKSGASRFRLRFVAAMGAFAVLCALVTLAGWYFNLPRLTDWGMDSISMFPNTALCALLTGASLLLLVDRRGVGPIWRAGAAVFGLAAMAIGLATLYEHATSIDLGIDTFLIMRSWGQTAAASPMRMGLPGSTSFTALGAALCVIASPWRWLRPAASALGTLCAAIASLSLIGYLYGADRLYSLPRWTGIAMQTAAAVLAISAGVVALVPEWGPCELLARRDGGGMLARRFFPALFVIAIALGWFRLYGQRVGLYDTAFGTAVRTVAEVMLFGLLVWWTSTAISRTEAKLRANRAELRAALDEANRAAHLKDEFLGTISHDLRNPMTAILGWAQTLRTDRKSDAEVAHGLQVIERSAKVQSQMIEDLLDVSKVVSGDVKLDIRWMDLTDVTRSAVDVVRPSAEGKGVRLETVFGEGVTQIRADRARIQQVLFNLLSNAVRSSVKGGVVRLTCTQRQGQAEFSVSDTGEGISPEMLPYAFDRFRARDGVVQKGGLGLGLAIVRNLVELHGGRVEAMSGGVGQGATYVARLPREIARTSEARGATSDEPVELAGLKVLIVDGDADVREWLKRALTGRGATVTEVSTADEAMALMPKVAPEVLICDVAMLGEEGYGLLRRVRESGAKVRAVALAGRAREEERRRAAGFDAHLAKPVEAGELFAAVKGK
ncbi:MAG: hybrid sensor histidine kinase/response regulator [Phycisphaerales bacterium]